MEQRIDESSIENKFYNVEYWDDFMNDRCNVAHKVHYPKNFLTLTVWYASIPL